MWGWLTTPADHSSLDDRQMTQADFSMLVKRIAVFYEVIEEAASGEGTLLEELVQLLEKTIKF